MQTAHHAFFDWKEVALRDRARYLFDMRTKFEEHFDKLCHVLTQDHGRTMSEAQGSVRRVIENIESACSASYNLAKHNEHIDQLAPGIDEYLIWEPLGAFLIITPGNVPMHSWSGFVPYALAAGCTVVISPSRQAPVCSDLLCKVVAEVGFPPGVMNVIHGGRHINEKILSMEEIKGVGFVGSSETGKRLFELCGRLGKTSSINGNGKNHIVIMPDADIDAGIEYMLAACFGMAGQRCLGTDNVVVMEEVYEEVKEKFTQAARKVKVGCGFDSDTRLVPLTTLTGKEKVVAWIDQSLEEGAKLVLDGRTVSVQDFPGGYFLGPTILEEVHPDMSTAKNEAFGPVAALIKAQNLEEVIKWINAKTYLGHSACILTSSGKYARKFIREVEVGNVGVNVGIPQPYAFFPMGSKRDSFFGAAKSRYSSMRLFMDEKTVTARWV